MLPVESPAVVRRAGHGQGHDPDHRNGEIETGDKIQTLLRVTIGDTVIPRIMIDLVIGVTAMIITAESVITADADSLRPSS